MTNAIAPAPRLFALRAAGLVIALFLAVYLPAFVIVGSLHPPLERAVPAVMLLTLIAACVLIAWFAWRRHASATDFGFAWPAWRYMGVGVVLAAIGSVLAAWMLAHVSEPGPLAGLHLAPWLGVVYFVGVAAIQEEVIFRGLLQSALAQRLGGVAKYASRAGIAASLSIAVLFALIHLAIGPVTALAALALGLLAGELRRLSGSLLPAIVCHAIFNLAGIFPLTH